MMRLAFTIATRFGAAAALAIMLLADPLSAQKASAKKPQTSKSSPATEISRLRDDYLKTTKEYKASLQTLLTLYQNSAKKADDRLNQSKELFADGLISKSDLENSEHLLAEENAKIAGVRQQIATADTQIAQGLVEIAGDKQFGKLRKGVLVQTTSMIRFGGAGAWLLSQSGQIQNFFVQKFGRVLPIAVFGQGSIHNQWRLDHHNAMDVSVYPDTIEGQALMDFLRANGIPFSAFRGAIPGVATGPHIHIGMPSHRY